MLWVLCTRKVRGQMAEPSEYTTLPVFPVGVQARKEGGCGVIDNKAPAQCVTDRDCDPSLGLTLR